MILNKKVDIVIEYLKRNGSILALILGGSRSKGQATKESDYDLFAIIQTDDFRAYRNSFVDYLEKCKLIKYAANYKYVENWGYIFKIILEYMNPPIFIDLTIIPFERISEMALRESNIILFDKTNSIERYTHSKTSFETKDLEPDRKLDYVKLFGFEYLRYHKSIDKNDYSLAIKALDRMKAYYMHYKRIKTGVFANTQHCPEKRFGIDFPDDLIYQSLLCNKTSPEIQEKERILVNAFAQLIDEGDIFEYFQNFYCAK